MPTSKEIAEQANATWRPLCSASFKAYSAAKAADEQVKDFQEFAAACAAKDSQAWQNAAEAWQNAADAWQRVAAAAWDAAAAAVEADAASDAATLQVRAAKL